MVTRSHASSTSRPLIGLACTLALANMLAGCTIDGVAILAGNDLDEVGDELDEGDTESNESSDPVDEAGDNLDLPNGDGVELGLACEVHDEELDAAPPCDAQRASAHLAPVVAWTWTGPSGEDSVLVTPLVGNVDDDNLDGNTDPCDRPEVIVLAVDAPANKDDSLPSGHLYVLDTVSGETKWKIDRPIDATATPALADLDDDGVPEILAFERSVDLIGQIGERRVVALGADGSEVWVSDTWVLSSGGGGLAIADLDADGSPEILAPEHVLSADGTLLWAPPIPPLADSLPIAADLDADGKLEVLFGRSVYTHDGEELYELALPGNKNEGVSAIANFDDDPHPEIYVHSHHSHRIFEHDSTLKVQCEGANDKDLPITIVDTNADGRAEILSTGEDTFEVLTIGSSNNLPTCDLLWSTKVSDGSTAAFDFLADGSAEAIYSDLSWVRIFNLSGEPIAEFERTARASMANPVVADADNDGAAELIIVGSEPDGGDEDIGSRASVIFIENDDDRFAPTRRIWNQHAYHATNIREDARVPVEQVPHWIESNGFRTNPAPSYSGASCQPSPLP